ncbi:MAG: hypothetical protein NT091_01690 [Candidatus Falkowbacteria bacterium]|nr:hypothetical protein [Candidatus Falkowbacteria bacterium]
MEMNPIIGKVAASLLSSMRFHIGTNPGLSEKDGHPQGHEKQHHPKGIFEKMTAHTVEARWASIVSLLDSSEKDIIVRFIDRCGKENPGDMRNILVNVAATHELHPTTAYVAIKEIAKQGIDDEQNSKEWYSSMFQNFALFRMNKTTLGITNFVNNLKSVFQLTMPRINALEKLRAEYESMKGDDALVGKSSFIGAMFDNHEVNRQAQERVSRWQFWKW